MCRTKWTPAAIGAGAFALALSAGAAEALSVRDAWIPAPVAGQDIAAGYLSIESPVAARVVAAESDAARAVQFHQMSMDGGVMRMRRVDALELPAGRTVQLAPGGVHLMLMGLSQPLRPGAMVSVRLTVSEGGGERRVVHVTLPVVDRRQGQAGGHD